MTQEKISTRIAQATTAIKAALKSNYTQFDWWVDMVAESPTLNITTEINIFHHVDLEKIMEICKPLDLLMNISMQYVYQGKWHETERMVLSIYDKKLLEN